jgi:hypothetical protein
LKFQVQMKDPDTLSDAIADAVDEELKPLNLPEDEREAVAEKRIEKVGDVCDKWFKYGEYLTVEIDTEAKTCVVLDAK